MCGVVHTIQERNLSFVTFHLHMLAICNQRAAEAFPVAVVMCDLIVVWQLFQFIYNPCICSIKSSANAMSKCTNA